MRVVVFMVLSLAALVSREASAQDWKSLSKVEREARWNDCYMETRLIYRTRNHSEQQYRVMIKDARRTRMSECLARPRPPRPITSPDIAEREVKSSIAGWASNP
jgi:hypothetical protein